MPGVKKICKIDGEKIQTTEELLEVIKQEVATEEHKANSLTDILNTSGGIDIVWQNSDISSERLGNDFLKIVETIRDHGPEGARPTDNVHLFLN